MSYRHKNLDDLYSFTSKPLNRSTINSSLINISKQLNNISINDVNILKLKNEKIKLNSKNKNESSMETEFNNINPNRSFQYKKIHKSLLPLDNYIYDNQFKFYRAETFTISAYKYINSLNKNDLKKKNYILKENLKFLLNEIKKYKENEINYDKKQIKEYENKIECYINEINKYKKEIIILKEKYNNVVKENNELKKYLRIESNKINKGKLLISQKDLNSTLTHKPNNIKNLKCFKKININLKNYLNKNKNIIRENYSTCTTRASRNNKNIDLNIINNINSNKYLLIDDKNSFYKSNEKILPINNNLNINSGLIINSKIIKKNNKNIIINNKNMSQKIKNNIDKNRINQIIFSRIENNRIKNKYNNNRTISKNKLIKNNIKNTSFELNKTINLSQSFRYFTDNGIKNLYMNKNKKYIYLNNNNNNTFHY